LADKVSFSSVLRVLVFQVTVGSRYSREPPPEEREPTRQVILSVFGITHPLYIQSPLSDNYDVGLVRLPLPLVFNGKTKFFYLFRKLGHISDAKNLPVLGIPLEKRPFIATSIYIDLNCPDCSNTTVHELALRSTRL